jgi:hypothetical protein
MTSFQTAVPDVLDGLEARGFQPASSFVWSQHNYADVERNVATPTLAEQARMYLIGRWRGLGGPSFPELWLTEGGARLGQGEATDTATQAELVRLNWERMSAASGIRMWTNYLLHGDATADSGLSEARAGTGLPRPVWNVFASFPSHR